VSEEPNWREWYSQGAPRDGGGPNAARGHYGGHDYR
jgi:hypothetical protein